MNHSTKDTPGLESLIWDTARDLRDHGDFPGRWCEYFTEECIERMRQYGNTGFLCEHKCEYCNKFMWAVDRAKHYAEKTGVPYLDILNGWERDRDYWYMNYYQDCKQPEIKGDNVRIFDTLEDCRNSLQGKGFRCPSCGAETSNPCHCTCGWKSYGLFGCLGKGITVFVKKNMGMAEIFMPIAWEEKHDK